MKKLGVFLLILFFLIPLISAELTDDDLKKVEVVVRREVQSSNDKLRIELQNDIRSTRDEVKQVLDDISGASSLTKIILVLTLSGAVIVAEVCISFLKFLVWKSKRRLFKEEAVPKKQEFKAPEIFKKPKKEIAKLKKEKPKQEPKKSVGGKTSPTESEPKKRLPKIRKGKKEFSLVE